MKNMAVWVICFWSVLVTLMTGTYLIIGVNNLVLGCRPSRQFIEFVLVVSSVIGLVLALVMVHDKN